MQETENKNFVGTFSQEELSYLNKASEPLTLISLFSGCGGAALGIAMAGFEVRVFVEQDKYACQTLRANWTDELGGRTVTFKTQRRTPAILQRDITKTTTKEILDAADLRVGEATLLEGGFPCQGFSTANGATDRNDYTKDKRNFLYNECVRVIREALPKSFFLENVPGLVSMEKGRVIRMICDDLAKTGYDVNWDILNAADYGVPQNRRRVFIIGSRNDIAVFPEKGNMQFHIGGAVGRVHHPDWFLKKYKQ